MRLKIKVDKKLAYLSVSVNRGEFDKLLEQVGRGRPRRFDKVEFLSGVPVEVKGLKKKKRRSVFKRLPKETGLMSMGYYQPKKKSVAVFPEADLVWLLEHMVEVYENNPDNAYKSFVNKLRGVILSTVLEELEHGFQDFRSKKLLPKSVKFLYGVRSAVLTYGALVVIYVLTSKTEADWMWFAPFAAAYVVLGLFIVNDLRPKTGWEKDYYYASSAVEIEAKKVSRDTKLLKQSARAIKIKVKFGVKDFWELTKKVK